jgi:hypothetical protein
VDSCETIEDDAEGKPDAALVSASAGVAGSGTDAVDHRLKNTVHGKLSLRARSSTSHGVLSGKVKAGGNAPVSC